RALRPDRGSSTSLPKIPSLLPAAVTLLLHFLPMTRFTTTRCNSTPSFGSNFFWSAQQSRHNPIFFRLKVYDRSLQFHLKVFEATFHLSAAVTSQLHLFSSVTRSMTISCNFT
ncbi:hypothetical protein T310_8947, partial [Rasamsonia emersonii CBS 393.64]